ncbi:hypothetical protein DFH09DRAFT_1097344 [Mycena vulgaris]|nr:hypothetical protein DFH09DRAFT_1097344 [Mycena vulgaris]
MTQDSNPGSGNQPPVRPRKTHFSTTAIAALQKMSSVLKRKKNEEISDRNAGREYQHAKHLQNPQLADVSDVESFITVSTEPEKQESPASAMTKIMSKLSPASIRMFIRALPAFSGKRKIDEAPESEGRKQGKRLREEIALQPGMSLPTVFHDLLHDLKHFGVYIPLSIFTGPNLKHLNASHATVVTRRTNTLVQGQKEPRVLDTEIFERTYGRERDLDRGQFHEASRNYVAFLEKIHGANSAIVQRWHSHFGFFERVEHAQENFPTILATDIDLRLKYISQPFVFENHLYARELDQAIQRLRMSEMEARMAPSSSSRGGAPGAPGAGARGGGRGGGSARGGVRGGAPPPFQGGAGGAAPAPVCLVCARRGHLWKDCNVMLFKDGGILHCVVRAPDIWALQSQQTLCRAWNAKGPQSTCAHDPALRAHLCSFCGSRDHHAFA